MASRGPVVLDARSVVCFPEWFTMGGIDDARAILSAMLGSVSTVLALIFSVAPLVLSMRTSPVYRFFRSTLG